MLCFIKKEKSMQISQIKQQQYKSNPSFQRLTLEGINTKKNPSQLAEDAISLILAAPKKKGMFKLLKRAKEDDIAIRGIDEKPSNYLALEVQHNGIFKQKILFFQNNLPAEELARKIKKVFTAIYREIAQHVEYAKVSGKTGADFYTCGAPLEKIFAQTNTSALPS